MPAIPASQAMSWVRTALAFPARRYLRKFTNVKTSVPRAAKALNCIFRLLLCTAHLTTYPDWPRAAAVTPSPMLAGRLGPPETPSPETRCREMGLSRARLEGGLGKHRTGGLPLLGCPRRDRHGSTHGGRSLSGVHPQWLRA